MLTQRSASATFLLPTRLVFGARVPAAFRPVRAVFRYGATRVLETQRQLTEWHLSHVRFGERQIGSWFELYRVGLEANLRFTEAATRTLIAVGQPREADVAGPSAG